MSQWFTLCIETLTCPISHLIISCAILELYRYITGIVAESENSYFVQDNSGIVPILTLRRTHGYIH